MKRTIVAIAAALTIALASFAGTAQAKVYHIHGACWSYQAGYWAQLNGVWYDCIFVGPVSSTLYGWVPLQEI